MSQNKQNRSNLDPWQLFDLSGTVAVVTGGSGVLGGTVCHGLARAGVRVGVMGRHRERLQSVVEAIQAEGGEAMALTADVLDQGQLEAARDAVLARWGRVDHLLNFAGGNRPEATVSPDLPFFELSQEALEGVVRLNLLGTLLPCQVFGRVMAQRGEGVILNVSSMAAFRPLTRVVGYAAAKAAVNNFTRWLAVHMAQEYSPRIRVNAIAPGFFLTHQNRYLLIDEATGELTPRGQRIIDHTPMGRFGDPEDLLGTVLWLLSPASAFVTGIVVPVDGGFSAFSGV